MKRLTYKDAVGNWVVACNRFWNYIKLKLPAHLRGEAIDRLAKYENTGMEPEDILNATDMAKVACALHELNRYKELGNLGRLRELVQADREERYMILPRGRYSKQDGEKALKHAVFGCQMYDNAVNKYIADAVAEKLARESEEKENKQ